MTDQTQTTDNTEPAQEELLALASLDQLGFLVASWFENNHAQAAALMEVPDGQSITVTFEEDGQPEELILTGDTLKGWKAGIIVMTNVFGQLPFQRMVMNADNGTPVASQEELDAALAAKKDDAPASGN